MTNFTLKEYMMMIITKAEISAALCAHVAREGLLSLLKIINLFSV